MRPNLGDGKVNKLLTNFSLRYSNDLYIAEQILLPLGVKEITGKYAKYGKENLRAYTGEIFRAPGTRAHTVDYSVSQGDYQCRERSLEKLLPDEFARNTDDPFQPKRDTVATLLDNMMVNQELALATALNDTSIITKYTTISASTDKWTDKTNSDPIGQIQTAINGVITNSGMVPNLVVLSWDAFLALKIHPDIREQVKYTNGGQFSDGALISFLKEFFRLDEVLIGRCVYSSAHEGQTEVLSQVWTANVWAMVRAKTPSLMKATFGLTLYDQSEGDAILVETYREEPKVSDVIRVRKSYDQNIFDANLCYELKGVV